MKFILRYQPSPDMGMQEWPAKTVDEWLIPNGNESLLVYMMRQCAERDLAFFLQGVTDEEADEVVELMKE